MNDPPHSLPARVEAVVAAVQAELETLQHADTDEARVRAANEVRALLEELALHARQEAREGTGPQWVDGVLKTLSTEVVRHILETWLWKYSVAYANCERKYVRKTRRRDSGTTRVVWLLAA